MKAFRPRWTDLILLVLAVLVNLTPELLIPLRGYGTVCFASAYGQVHIGMTLEQWKSVERQNRVEAVCDGNSCYVFDLFRTYRVVFQKIDGDAPRIYSKATYVHLRLPGYYW